MKKMINAMVEEICEQFFMKGEYEDLPAKREASEAIYTLYWNNPEFKDVRAELENAISQSELESERQGFILGFNKAMEILESGVR